MRSLGEVVPHQLPLVMDPSRPAETVECPNGGWPRMTKTQAHRFVDDYSTRLRPERKQALRNQVGEAWLGDEHGLNALEILANDEIDLYLRRRMAVRPQMIPEPVLWAVILAAWEPIARRWESWATEQGYRQPEPLSGALLTTREYLRGNATESDLFRIYYDTDHAGWWAECEQGNGRAAVYAWCVRRVATADINTALQCINQIPWNLLTQTIQTVTSANQNQTNNGGNQ